MTKLYEEVRSAVDRSDAPDSETGVAVLGNRLAVVSNLPDFRWRWPPSFLLVGRDGRYYVWGLCPRGIFRSLDEAVERLLEA